MSDPLPRLPQDRPPQDDPPPPGEAVPLIVGLGNPGPEYEGTRHNVGFRVLDRLVVDLLAGDRSTGDRSAGDPMASAGGGSRPLFLPGRKLEGYRGPRAFRWARSATPAALLVKPETFMNLSGDVVLPLARWLHGPGAGAAEPGFDPARILVVYDDLDLPLGALRIRPHGGAGGHNGMRSIRDRLLTDRFPRLRVGIGSSRTDAARHVLSTFTDAEEVEIQISIAEAAEALRHWLESGDLDECMTRFHSRWNQG